MIGGANPHPVELLGGGGGGGGSGLPSPLVPIPLLFLDEAMHEKAGLEVSLLCSPILFYLHIPHNNTMRHTLFSDDSLPLIVRSMCCC